MVVEFQVFDLINFVSASMFVVRNFICANFFEMSERFRVPLIVTVFFICPFVAHECFKISLESMAHTTWIAWILSFMFPAILYQKRISRRRANYFWMINRMILDIKTGKSLRWSFKNSYQAFTASDEQWLSEVEKFVSFSQQLTTQNWMTGREDQMFLSCLHSAFNSSSHSLIILEAYRDHMTMNRNFRRRSRQVTVQIRAQMSVLGVMYAAALLYFVRRNETLQSPFVYLSAILFFGGLVMIYLIGRKTKWST